MIGDPVDDDPEAALVSFGKQPVEVGQAAEERIDVAVVADVVAVVLHRRAEEGLIQIASMPSRTR